MFGFGTDDIVYFLLGTVGLALLGVIAARSKKVCDQLTTIAETCQRRHQKGGEGE